MLLVTFEEREPEFRGLDCLLRSVARVQRDVPLLLATVPSQRDRARELAENSEANVSIVEMSERVWGYTIKPTLLLKVLRERTERPVVWIDSDVVACRPFRELFAGISREALIATQEYLGAQDSGSEPRCHMHGQTEARRFERTINTGIVGVTDAHIPLLEAWKKRMEEPDFEATQQLSPPERPFWLGSDQDMLTLLMASSHAHVPVHLLRSGIDIAQELPGAGYALSERLYNVWHGFPPYFAHAMGDAKPWRIASSASVTPFKLSSIQLSQYVHSARALYPAEQLPDYLKTTTPDARLVETLVLGSSLFKGLAHNALYTAARGIYRNLVKPARESLASRPDTALPGPETGVDAAGHNEADRSPELARPEAQQQAL